MIEKIPKEVAIIVAHPDDETLWIGGTILSHPSWRCFIICLSRKNDSERATKFYKALEIFNSKGIMGDLDDGPTQQPLDEKEVERMILTLLPQKHFDLIISHNPAGEYTRHLRHEEVAKSVIKLWHSGEIAGNELWLFAYEDNNREYYPRAIENATIVQVLTKRIWLRKYGIITGTYGFETNSWEAETTPRVEAFWQFLNPQEAMKWLVRYKNSRIN